MAFYDSEYLRLKLACGGEMPGLRTTLMALDSGTINAAGTVTGGPILTTGTAAGTIPANRLVKAHTDATLLVGTLASKRIIGVNAGDAVVSTGTVTLGTGYVTGVAAEPIIAGESLKCGDNGRLLVLADADHLSTAIGTGTAGNFGNQALTMNAAVEVLSASAADVTQTVTIIGTTTATDTVVTETVTLTGTDPVTTTKTNWGFILAVKLSASCAGTVTVRTTADAAITTILTTVLQAGVVVIAAASQGCHGLIPSIVAAGASTKVVGVKYEPATGAADAYMSKALNGTTVVPLPAAANRVMEIYIGDVATGTVATCSTCATEDDENIRVGKAVASIATAASGTILLMPV